jgi:hypothetical protein
MSACKELQDPSPAAAISLRLTVQLAPVPATIGIFELRAGGIEADPKPRQASEECMNPTWEQARSI